MMKIRESVDIVPVEYTVDCADERRPGLIGKYYH